MEAAIVENPMFRRSIQLLALAATAAVGTVSSAVAGGPCCVCAAPVACEPFYIVNHGPVYSGPGIIVSPAYFELDRWPAYYPYVGRTYWYQPYDGGPYFEPSRHGTYHRHAVHRWQRPAPYPRVPRQLVPPPLDPRDK